MVVFSGTGFIKTVTFTSDGAGSGSDNVLGIGIQVSPRLISAGDITVDEDVGLSYVVRRASDGVQVLSGELDLVENMKDQCMFFASPTLAAADATADLYLVDAYVNDDVDIGDGCTDDEILADAGDRRKIDRDDIPHVVVAFQIF